MTARITAIIVFFPITCLLIVVILHLLLRSSARPRLRSCSVLDMIVCYFSQNASRYSLLLCKYLAPYVHCFPQSAADVWLLQPFSSALLLPALLSGRSRSSDPERNNDVPVEQKSFTFITAGDMRQLLLRYIQLFGQDLPVSGCLIQHQNEVAVFKYVLDFP